MNILYLKINKHGIGNITCNIIILLIWILKSKKYDKLVVINWKNRIDLFDRYCNEIKNDLFEFIKTNSKISKNCLTLKQFLKLNFGKISNYLNKSPNELTDIYFHYLKAAKDDLILVKKYFDLQPNKLINDIINKTKNDIGNYISIHIRSTDLIPDYKINKTINVYYEFIDRNKDKKIYLATDCQKYQKLFKDKYQSRLYYFENINDNSVFKRNTSHISIYIDLFMCRDSNDFLGTEKSTFTQLIKILRFVK